MWNGFIPPIISLYLFLHLQILIAGNQSMNIKNPFKANCLNSLFERYLNKIAKGGEINIKNHWNILAVLNPILIVELI